MRLRPRENTWESATSVVDKTTAVVAPAVAPQAHTRPPPNASERPVRCPHSIRRHGARSIDSDARIEQTKRHRALQTYQARPAQRHTGGVIDPSLALHKKFGLCTANGAPTVNLSMVSHLAVPRKSAPCRVVVLGPYPPSPSLPHPLRVTLAALAGHAGRERARRAS